MKLRSWQTVLGVSLLAASTAAYFIQIALFHRNEDTLFYLLQDLAFLPVQVFLVTIVLNDLFKRREQASLNNKMNMAIGAFFGEVGTQLLKSLSSFDAYRQDLSEALIFRPDWKPKDFLSATQKIRTWKHSIELGKGDLLALKNLLLGKRQFLLGLLENSNLIEHERFTDLLWAVFHLTEELDYRSELSSLSKADRDHLAADMRRALGHLLVAWLSYNQHLQTAYPYIYSLAMRTNPFDSNASVEFR